MIMANELHIGVDLGGTRIRAARFDAELAMQERVETLTDAPDGPDAVIGRIVAQVKAVWPKTGTVGGVGISVPGPMNPYTGIVVAPPNLPGWHNVPLKAVLEEKLGVPVHLGNDANLAALAEYEMGAGRGYKDLIYITVSTGIGSGVISNGRLLIGNEGLGAECGHLIIFTDEENVSTLEKEAAGPAIARMARAMIERGEPSTILDMVSSPMEIDARHVSEAAKNGDRLSIRILSRAGRLIGLGLVSLLHTFNPEIVVIGGSVAEYNWEILSRPMQWAIQHYAIDSAYWKKLVVAPAALGENVCLIGAGALSLRGKEV
jgi:glucokinase